MAPLSGWGRNPQGRVPRGSAQRAPATKPTKIPWQESPATESPGGIKRSRPQGRRHWNNPTS
eukprot:157575-Pyramimonas_sp.AAC.1